MWVFANYRFAGIGRAPPCCMMMKVIILDTLVDLSSPSYWCKIYQKVLIKEHQGQG